MNIAFVANFTKTDFFDQVAQELLNKGISVYWFVVNTKQSKELIKRYSVDNVLLINKEGLIILDNSDRHPDIAEYFRENGFIQVSRKKNIIEFL